MATTFDNLPEEFRFDITGERQVTFGSFDDVDQEADALEHFQDRIDAIDERLNAKVKGMTPEEYRDAPASEFALNLKDIIKQTDAGSFAKAALGEVFDDGRPYGGTDGHSPNGKTSSGHGGPDFP